jgi:diguanylate cyclase (GGDEF)-like protein
MSVEYDLSHVLSDFARTMVTDFPIQAILDSLVTRIVEILPITSAGVSLISAGQAPRYIAASDEAALRFERLQTQLGQGPCILAYASGRAVAVPHLASDTRFSLFRPAAVAAGLGAVFTFPLRHGESQLGALDLYRDVAGDLNAADMVAAQTLADVAAAYLLNAHARDLAQQTSDHFHQLSQHDPLTGLPNRVSLLNRIEHAAQRAQRSGSNAAILFVDIDRFKHVNDTYGHHVGDQLLLAIAGRLSPLVRPGDTLARVSGDEFIFLCEDLDDAADADLLAARVGTAFAAPFRLPTAELIVTASVGVAFAGPGVQVNDDLLVEADAAMYQAKRQGGGRHQVIDVREARESSDSERLERDLRIAFAERELQVVYQPIVRTADGLLTGVEALLRWTHPTRGPVPPLQVVQIAERSGLIIDIGSWVLERACRDRARWLTQHPSAPLDLAVNISTRQLVHPDYAATVAAALADSGMDRASLILEMTENILIEESERATAALAELREVGARLALDDFGTGYSSLSYLRRLPVHIVKIDQSFVADIGDGLTDGSIVAAVTNLAHDLGLSVTAEGVETLAQRDAVISVGCDCSQGFYYARPMPAEAIGSYLAASSTAAPTLPLGHTGNGERQSA